LQGLPGVLLNFLGGFRFWRAMMGVMRSRSLFQRPDQVVAQRVGLRISTSP
jgi:hypothetical protein